MRTIWLPVKGYKRLYEVSNKGKVKSLRHKVKLILKPRYRYRYNYKSVAVLLSYKGKDTEKQISRLVAEAFIPNPLNKPCVNHIDNDTTNNQVDNLEWVTHKENSQHASLQNRLKGRYNGGIGINYLRNKEKLAKVGK